MKKALGVFILISLGVAFITPGGLRAGQRTIADVSALVETTVSPISDPDPHDDTSIAVSRKNDQVIVGASKVIQGGGGPTAQGNSRVAYYFSSNGGLTWGNGLIGLDTPQKTWGRSVDPSVVSDLDGNFYLCVRMADPFNFDTGIYVFKSTDDGHTFANPDPVVVDIGHIADPTQAGKCHVTVDASSTSPFKGTIYAVWTSTGNDALGVNSTVIRFARRRPGDLSFSASEPLGHAGDMRAPSLTTGPNGEFYAAWVGMPARILLFNSSTDGGDTFLRGPSSLDTLIREIPGSFDGPNQRFFIDGVPRANSFPTLDVDRSFGPNRGVVYLAWAECRNGTDADIFVEKLTPRPGSPPDLGLPVKVNQDGFQVDQFFPWLSVDSSTGAVEVAFYDRRDDPGLMNLYLGRSTDGGATFDNTRISSASSDPRIQASIAANTTSIGIGDYVGLVANGGKAHMLWTDTRRGKQEIFYGQLNIDSSAPPPPPPPGGLSGDDCQSPRVIASLPFLETLDTRAATSSPDDPLSCTGAADTNTVWYTFTSPTTSVYGIETSASDYDTVLSVYTGLCGSLTRVACSDDFGNPSSAGNRSVLTFSATGGVRYLIEASGKGTGGSLKIRAGFPTITGFEYTKAPDGSDSFKISGAGFVNGNVAVTAQLDGEDVPLPNLFFVGPPLPDGTDTTLFAWKKKLKKLVKRGSLLVRVESPIGSGNISNKFLFTR